MVEQIGGGLSKMSGGDTQAIIEAVERLHGVQIERIISPDDVSVDPYVAIVPHGVAIKSIKSFVDEWRERPERVQATVPMLSAASFIDYLKRVKNPDSAVYVRDDPGGVTNGFSGAKMVGVIDHDGQGAALAPAFGQHRVTYEFPLSDQMKAWLAATAKGLMEQAEFAHFLEDRLVDVENPPLDWMMVDAVDVTRILAALNLQDDRGTIDDITADAAAGDGAGDELEDRYIPRSALYKLRRIRFATEARLLALSRGIEIAVNARAKESYNPRTGEREVVFFEEHQTNDKEGRKVVVPDAFFVNIPVFENGLRHLMPVRLYYRRKGSSPAWGIELIDARRLIRMAIADVADKVRKETGLPVFFGTRA